MDATLGDLRQTGPVENPIRIECSASAIESIQAEVSEAFYSVPRGGAETGGVLYGTQQDGSVRILAARPLPLEHAFGPSFQLSSNDCRRLEALIGATRHDRSLAGLSVVGWYHSHTRSDLRFSEADAEIHKRYFPEPWQVALVLRPAPLQPTRMGYFVREAGGGFAGPRQEGIIAPRPRTRTAREKPAPPRTPPPPTLDDAPAGNAAAPQSRSPVTAPEFSEPVEAASGTGISAWMWVSAAALLCAVGAGFYLWNGRSADAGLGLRAVDREGQIELQWDAGSPLLRGARSGTLEIVDGDEKQTVALDPTFLRAGTVSYTRRSPAVKFRLGIVTADGAIADQFTTVIGASPDAADKAAAPPPAPAIPAPAARAAPAKPTPVPNPAASPQRTQSATALRKFVPPPQAPPSRQAAVAPANAAGPPPLLAPSPAAAPAAPPQSAPLQAALRAPAPPAAPAVSAPVPPAVRPAAPSLVGQWTFSRSSPSGSPFRPDSISLSILESSGGLQGVFAGRYRTSKESGLKPDVTLLFHGDSGSGRMRFPWTAADGSRGQIEFIRLPNSDSLEVVWYTQDRKFVFDDVLVRSGK